MSRNYLITGACRGIGRGLSRLLLQKGHRVFLLDNNETEIEQMHKQLPEWLSSSSSSSTNVPKERYLICQADLSNPEDITRAAKTADTFFQGHLDVLINNAAYTSGVIHEHKFDEPSFLEIWHKSLTINLTGSMLLSRACLPLLRKTTTRSQGGSIIFMSSTRAYQSEPFSEAYATTKAGLLGLSQALSCSLAQDNVKVNCILPGWINVGHECKEGDDKNATWKDGLSDDDHRWHFTGRVGKVEDILRAVLFFAQTGSTRGVGSNTNTDTDTIEHDDVDDGGFITGQELIVDGGVTRKMVYPE